MRTSRLFAIGTLASSFAWLLAGGCAAGGEDGSANGGNSAGSGGSFSNTGGTMISMPDAAGPGAGTTSTLNPLCGLGECLPDSAKWCRDYQPPGGGNGGQGGTSGASSGQGGASGGEGGASGGESGNATGGQAGAPNGEGGEAGVAGTAGANQGGAHGGGEGGRGGEGGQTEPEPPSPYGCQVTRQNNQPLRQCEPAGTGEENAPCFSSADCVAELACVTEGAAGRCLRYCCSQSTVCGANSYCAERQLRTPTSTEPVPVPVCVPADGCSLDEQPNCSDQECRCKGDTDCMLVRSGITTCLKPGAGQQGEACPCAWNHLCSSVTNQCVKICHTDPSKSECGTQKCQASDELPPTFGICVGPLR